MTTHGDAFVEIQKEGGDAALKLVGDLMEHSRQMAEYPFELQIQIEKDRADRAEARCEALEERLTVMHARLMWLAGADLTDEEKERL